MIHHPMPNDEALEVIIASPNEGGDSQSPVRYSDYYQRTLHPTYIRLLEDIEQPEEPMRYGYSALSGLKKNEVLEVVERWHDDYWVAMCEDGRCGLIRMDHRIAFVVTSKVRAIWWREKERSVEMGFEVGAEMTLLYPRDNVWVWAMLDAGSDVGLVPYSFIESIQPDLTSTTEPSYSPSPERPYGDLEWNPSEIIDAKREKVRALWEYSDDDTRFISLAKNDIIEVLAKPHEHWWVGVVFPTDASEAGSIERVGMLPRNYIHHSLTRTPSPIEGRTLVRPPWSPYYVRAAFTREPGHTYELGLVKGDIVEVETISPDMWWRGRNRSGKEGWLPENYVTPVLSRFHPTQRTSS